MFGARGGGCCSVCSRGAPGRRHPLRAAAASRPPLCRVHCHWCTPRPRPRSRLVLGAGRDGGRWLFCALGGGGAGVRRSGRGRWPQPQPKMLKSVGLGTGSGSTAGGSGGAGSSAREVVLGAETAAAGLRARLVVSACRRPPPRGRATAHWQAGSGRTTVAAAAVVAVKAVVAVAAAAAHDVVSADEGQSARCGPSRRGWCAIVNYLPCNVDAGVCCHRRPLVSRLLAPVPPAPLHGGAKTRLSSAVPLAEGIE